MPHVGYQNNNTVVWWFALFCLCELWKWNILLKHEAATEPFLACQFNRCLFDEPVTLSSSPVVHHKPVEENGFKTIFPLLLPSLDLMNTRSINERSVSNDLKATHGLFFPALLFSLIPRTAPFTWSAVDWKIPWRSFLSPSPSWSLHPRAKAPTGSSTPERRSTPGFPWIDTRGASRDQSRSTDVFKVRSTIKIKAWKKNL